MTVEEERSDRPFRRTATEGSLSVFASRVAHEDAACAVWAAGEIDISTAPRLWACLDIALGGRRPVVLDLEGISFMDAAAIPVLLAARQLSTELGTSFRVRQPSRAVLRVLDIIGLCDLVDI